VVIREMKVIYKTEQGETTPVLNQPSKAYDFIKSKIGRETKENFIAIYLDNKMRAMGWHLVSLGTVSESIVHPREIFKVALLCNATSVILSHNHPTGELSPSSEDVSTTKRIKEAGEIIGIPVIDHIIVSETSYLSFKESNIVL
jgi:DNA repair protein RadC